MKKLTFLVAALCATMALNAAEVVTSVATCNSADVVDNSAYTAYENDAWSVSVGGNNKSFGFNKSKITKLPNAYGTAASTANSGFTVVSKNALSKVNRVVFSYGGNSGACGKLYLAYSVDGSTWQEVALATTSPNAQGADLTKTAMQFDFNAEIASAYYAFVFDAGKTMSGAYRFDDVVIELQNVEIKVVAVEDPAFSVPGGAYLSNQSVELTCVTDGASIYYTLDGSDPDDTKTLYESAISVTETTTIKAIAIKGADQSNIVSATYTFPEEVADLAAFIAKADKENYVRVLSECVVTYRLDEKNVYVQDASAGMLIYLSAGGLATYNAGDRLTGIIGKYAMYSGQNELVPALEAMPTPVAGEALTPAALTIPDVVADIQNQYIKLSSVSFKADATFTKGTAGNKVNITDGTNELVVYNKFKIMDGTYAASKKYDIVGIAIDYQGTKESYIGIYPISVTEQSTTAIESVEMSNIYAHSGRIYGAEQGRIYTINGMDVTEQNGQLSNGIYIVKVGATATKIAVK